MTNEYCIKNPKNFFFQLILIESSINRKLVT